MTNTDDDLRVVLARLQGRIEARMDSQDRKMELIHEEVKHTNGRVKQLEIEQARSEGASRARDIDGQRVRWWIATAIAASGVIAAVAGAATAALMG